MEVKYDDEDYSVTDDMKVTFTNHGYIVVRNLFSADEIKQLQRNYEEGEAYHVKGMQDKDLGGKRNVQSTVMWTRPGDDVFGMAAKTQKLVETSSQLLGGEVYHFQSRIVTRYPSNEEDSAWSHDYRNLYSPYVQASDLVTAFIAIDPARKNEGCIQVLDSSHTDTSSTVSEEEVHGEDERIKNLQSRCPLCNIELESGDAAFLHSNLLYRMDANTDDVKKMTFQPVYNLRSNSPLKEGPYPEYSPLDVVYNDAVLDCENYTDQGDKQFTSNSPGTSS